jgi:hypothetical protein
MKEKTLNTYLTIRIDPRTLADLKKESAKQELTQSKLALHYIREGLRVSPNKQISGV